MGGGLFFFAPQTAHHGVYAINPSSTTVNLPQKNPRSGILYYEWHVYIPCYKIIHYKGLNRVAQ